MKGVTYNSRSAMQTGAGQLPRILYALTALSALVCAAPAGPATPPIPSVRFHHFHFRVAEPAASMNQAAIALKGTRVLLRGLGVGVRVGGEYALFDRLDASEVLADTRPSLSAAYAAAREWLSAHGVDVDADRGTTRADFETMFASETLDHIGFTTGDTSGVVAALIAHGAKAGQQTDDSRLFRTTKNGAIEIVRDLDAPDAFWCPMHPDIRSSVAGRCPLCAMELVPIPPPQLGEYRMDIAVAPGPGGRGATKLRMTLRDPVSNRPAAGFMTVHERLLHLFIIDRKLEYFRHVHPQQVGEGAFEWSEALPPGEFVLITDFLPQGGRAQMLQRAIVTPGYRGSLFPATLDLIPDASTEKTIDGVRVKLDATGLKAGKEAALTFKLTDGATGAPVSDLEPFLGAPGHMLLVNADLTEADHVHPEEPATRGPVVTFQPLMPASGTYKLWFQFQRHGSVTTVPFVISVAGP
jgi:Heavy metal binding domain